MEQIKVQGKLEKAKGMKEMLQIQHKYINQKISFISVIKRRKLNSITFSSTPHRASFFR